MTRWDHIKNGQIYSFKGGIYPCEHKHTKTVASIELGIPELLVLPLKQHSGSAAEVLVKEGQHVLANAPLTAPKSTMQVPIHAPVSGTIVCLGNKPIAHPSGLTEPCIVLSPDPVDKQEKFLNQAYPNYLNEDPVVLLQHIKNMGIAGLGGAGFPTDVKLRSSVCNDTPCELLIINGAECEPYITCDDRLMCERASEIIDGISVLQHVLKPRYTVIAIEDNKPMAIQTINNAISTKKINDIRVTALPVKYPSGAARNLIKIITGIEVPYSARSSSYGVVVQNVSTAFAVGEAVIKGQPLVKRMLTVAGEALAKPGNIWAFLGTSILDLLNACEFKAPTQPRIIVGGPMMGFTLINANVPIIKTTNCILAPDASEIKRIKPQVDCIHCGRCAKVCPSRLVPYELYDYCVTEEHERALKNGLKSCIECGCCSFVCPSAIRLVESFRQEKAKVKAENKRTTKLEIARERFIQKKIRLEEEEKLRAERKAAALAKAKAMQEAKAKLANDDKTNSKNGAIK
jgi:Na+-translocating ferredoxin:NAD+ oxidoreductase subunit C